jgi:S-adenosylmethionine-diacylglycerol 3-amino-3-carboxypropyl transferase
MSGPPHADDPLSSEVARELDFDLVRYSQVWEDSRLLDHSLEIGPDDDVLSITSGGCNVLALLLQAPRSITAIDMSPAQTALAELKLAGIRRLDHPDFACLVGARDGRDRWALYRRVRDDLAERSVDFWDAHRADIEAGVIHCGRLESYFRVFREDHLPQVWPEGLAERLLDAPSVAAQARLFREEADTEAFRELLGWYAGRTMLARHGRDPAQFRHVGDQDVGRHFVERFRHVCTRVPLRGNFYVEYFLTGRYRDLSSGPPYLRPHNFERLRAMLDRVVLVEDELERLVERSPPGGFSKANLSDIFEYMSEELAGRVFAALAGHLRSGGRLAYWNLLVPRSPPESLRDRLKSHSALARRLWRGDRSWFYRAFHVEEVTGR